MIKAKMILDRMASLKVTVFSLLFLMILTIVGTLYQARYGLYFSQKKVFYSFFFLCGGVFPLPGVRLILWILFLNLVASLLTRWSVFKQKWTLIIVHFGILLLFVSAFGKFHFGHEGYVFLKEKESTRQSLDYRKWEVAFFTKDQKTRYVSAIDLRTLLQKKTVFFEDFFQKTTKLRIKVLLHYPNSFAYLKGPFWNDSYKNGSGIRRLERQKKKKKEEENLPGILLEIENELSQKETLLLYGGEKFPTSFQKGTTLYFVQLRKKRYSLPVKVTLKTVKREVYPHTETASAYHSVIGVDDGHMERDVWIEMNKPFRSHNHTFFQSSYSENTKKEKFSTLAVLYNPFMFLPYIASLIIVLGLFLHFILEISKRALGRTIGVFFLFFLLPSLSLHSHIPKASLKRWSSFPIMDDGRLKPMETFAQNELLLLSGKKKIGNISASEWLLNLMMNPKMGENQYVFQINNPEILQSLGLFKEHKRYYSFKDLREKEQLLLFFVAKVQKISPNERTAIDKEYMRVWINYSHYKELSQTLLFLEPSKKFVIENAEVLKKLDLSIENIADSLSFYEIFQRISVLRECVDQVVNKSSELHSPSDREILSLINNLVQWIHNQHPSLLKIIYIEGHIDQWLDPIDLLKAKINISVVQKVFRYLSECQKAFRTKNWTEWDRHIEQIYLLNRQTWTDSSAFMKLSLENIYNRYRPMYVVKVASVFLLLLSLLFLLWSSPYLAFLLKILTFGLFLVHLCGLVLRTLILSRPPVTSLYETFIFVGLLSLGIGLIIEKSHKKGLGFFIAAFLEFVLMSIAGRYSVQGDTLQVLQAVLRSNFWLSTHVVAITIGYSFCLVAGLLGHLFLIKSLFKGNGKNLPFLTNTLYGTLGLALLFSFLGTVLGGIWADQSWGRFWGWDPKENGALLIVLWCSLVFHSKHAKMVEEWGFALLCAFVPIFVSLAWFGINLLGVGLHSYGFTEGVAYNLYLFIFCEIILFLFFYLFRKPLA